MTCKLVVGPQSVALDQTVPFDQRDVRHGTLARRMAELYHEVKQPSPNPNHRIKGQRRQLLEAHMLLANDMLKVCPFSSPI